ncbi:hypothetical protein [Ruegeria arenilitoris]|uniref:hypothetical protein n=1 Tax=Ruegeria arenilitoris TaxID=1173585 RepID=UPI001480DF6A|nr:hypothetical protein [Ruegeria arenilitoris]
MRADKRLDVFEQFGALGHGDHCKFAAVARVEQAHGHVIQRIVVLHINLSIAPFGGRFVLLFVGGTVEGLLILVAQKIDDFGDVELGFGQVFTGQPVAWASARRNAKGCAVDRCSAGCQNASGVFMRSGAS